MSPGFFLSYYHKAEWFAEGCYPKRLTNEEKIMSFFFFSNFVSSPGLVITSSSKCYTKCYIYVRTYPPNSHRTSSKQNCHTILL